MMKTPITGAELGHALLQRKNPELYQQLQLPPKLVSEALQTPYP